VKGVQVPILKQGPVLIATIQAALSDADLLELRSALVHQVVRYRSEGVIVDVTAMDVMDSFASRTLLEISHMIRLRGADTVIVGIQPDVAFAMVQLGLTLEDIPTALDLEEGLAYLQHRSNTIN
jgi:rsbT antagonist protein RsbS